MKIGKYEVTSDSYNIILSEKHKSKQGKSYSRPIGYYANIKELLKALVDREICDTGFEDLKKLSKKQEELSSMIQVLPTTKSYQTCKKEVSYAD